MNQFSNSKLTGFSQKLRKKMTPWERKLWYMFLKTYDVGFKRQKTIGKYIVDFYCAKAKLIVELDGGGHYTPEHMEYDNVRTDYLIKNGYKVVRFSNLDVDKNFYGVCSKIDEIVKSSSTSSVS